MQVLLLHGTATEQPSSKVIVWSLMKVLPAGRPIGFHFLGSVFAALPQLQSDAHGEQSILW